MAKRYVLISAKIIDSNDLVKKVNELLEKDYMLYGSPQVSTTDDGDIIYQAMTKD